MKTLTLDSPITEKAKPIAEAATRKAGQLITGWSFDPHPMRTKFIRGTKVGAGALIVGILIGWKRANS